MSDAPLPIYVRTQPVSRLGIKGRLVASTIALACLTVFLIAAWLQPDRRGLGTHEQLGLSPCGMTQLFGIPCPTCGYTTAFSFFVKGKLLASAWTQPAGFLFALACGVTFWVAGYIAVTGSMVHRLLSRWLTPTFVFSVGLIAMVGWGWKIALTRLAAGS